MKIYKMIGFLLLALTIQGCANQMTSDKVVEDTRPGLDNSAYDRWRFLTGKWYGAQKEVDGSKFEWILIRDQIGSFEYLSRNSKGKEALDNWRDFGTWGLAGPVYFVTTRAWYEGGELVYANMRDPSYRSAYHVINLDEHEFHYRAYTDGSEFKMRKVQDEFVFPEL